MNILIAFALFAAYVVGLCAIRKKLPSSLSQSVFLLPRGKSWMWTLMIFAVIVLLLVPFGLPFRTSILSHAEGWTVAPMMASLALLAVVGVAPLVPGDTMSIDYKVHMGAAWLSAILLHVVVIFNAPVLLLAWIPWFVAFVWITKDRSWRTEAFWAEITCIIMTFIFSFI